MRGRARVGRAVRKMRCGLSARALMRTATADHVSTSTPPSPGEAPCLQWWRAAGDSTDEEESVLGTTQTHSATAGGGVLSDSSPEAAGLTEEIRALWCLPPPADRPRTKQQLDERRQVAVSRRPPLTEGRRLAPACARDLQKSRSPAGGSKSPPGRRGAPPATPATPAAAEQAGWSREKSGNNLVGAAFALIAAAKFRGKLLRPTGWEREQQRRALTRRNQRIQAEEARRRSRIAPPVRLGRFDIKDIVDVPEPRHRATDEESEMATAQAVRNVLRDAIAGSARRKHYAMFGRPCTGSSEQAQSADGQPSEGAAGLTDSAAGDSQRHPSPPRQPLLTPSQSPCSARGSPPPAARALCSSGGTLAPDTSQSRPMVPQPPTKPREGPLRLRLRLRSARAREVAAGVPQTARPSAAQPGDAADWQRGASRRALSASTSTLAVNLRKRFAALVAAQSRGLAAAAAVSVGPLRVPAAAGSGRESRGPSPASGSGREGPSGGGTPSSSAHCVSSSSCAPPPVDRGTCVSGVTTPPQQSGQSPPRRPTSLSGLSPCALQPRPPQLASQAGASGESPPCQRQPQRPFSQQQEGADWWHLSGYDFDDKALRRQAERRLCTYRRHRSAAKGLSPKRELRRVAAMLATDRRTRNRHRHRSNPEGGSPPTSPRRAELCWQRYDAFRSHCTMRELRFYDSVRTELRRVADNADVLFAAKRNVLMDADHSQPISASRQQAEAAVGDRLCEQARAENEELRARWLADFSSRVLALSGASDTREALALIGRHVADNRLTPRHYDALVASMSDRTLYSDNVQFVLQHAAGAFRVPRRHFAELLARRQVYHRLEGKAYILQSERPPPAGLTDQLFAGVESSGAQQQQQQQQLGAGALGGAVTSRTEFSVQRELSTRSATSEKEGGRRHRGSSTANSARPQPSVQPPGRARRQPRHKAVLCPLSSPSLPGVRQTSQAITTPEIPLSPGAVGPLGPMPAISLQTPVCLPRRMQPASAGGAPAAGAAALDPAVATQQPAWAS
eukprot:TRINITY_DN3096_c0_g1_i1.p1 TRINITY_DN3096_c0_g1~~TRINITY_DN3096_c0_g1_i1.p1  ORF type:complete len:1052 (+),score=169.49 TRINITY_DN3096_c0_g1_i1:94-3156(+)